MLNAESSKKARFVDDMELFKFVSRQEDDKSIGDA